MPRFDPGGEVEALDRAGDAVPLVMGGLPSPESIFTIHCVAEIVRRTRDVVNVLPLNTGAEAEKLVDASPDAPMVPFFDAPDRDAREALLATGAPIVLVTGDFAETAQFCMVARHLDPLQAARFVSQSFCCLAPLRRHGQVRSVTLDKMQPLDAWLDQVAAWLGLDPAAWADARTQMLAEYAGWPTVEAAIHALVPSAHAASVGWEHVPSTTKTLFETLGTSYHSGSIDTIFWPIACLLEPGNPAFPVSDAIPLTGPTRLVTFGPFMHVPPGRWRARYQFEVDAHPAGNVIDFDIVQGSNVLVSHRVALDQAGTFGIDSGFEMHEPRLGVENRAILAEGSIGGVFKPIGIWLSRND